MRKNIVRFILILTLVTGVASYSAPQVFAGGGGGGSHHCPGC
ncbi:MAG: hypothetical protein AAGK74_14590 [Chloroflexota bacterium]